MQKLQKLCGWQEIVPRPGKVRRFNPTMRTAIQEFHFEAMVQNSINLDFPATPECMHACKQFCRDRIATENICLTGKRRRPAIGTIIDDLFRRDHPIQRVIKADGKIEAPESRIPLHCLWASRVAMHGMGLLPSGSSSITGNWRQPRSTHTSKTANRRARPNRRQQ